MLAVPVRSRGDSPALEREKERIDAPRSVLRTVTHCEIRPTVTASRTRSIKSDDADAETTRLGCVYRAIVETECCNLARQATPLRDVIPDDGGFVANNLRK